MKVVNPLIPRDENRLETLNRATELSQLRSTPLELARRTRCKGCVRALEAHAVLWQGWVDHEQKILMRLGITWQMKTLGKP